ncbi:hypothetical protein BDB00DRAFT_774825 [Zychaea mexicana]|uniref:uncharacterized protein n=1 Tax=Zychaea mexicana TaxID=64656 RepID=UPI0022FE9250|nr:uncharacterized protein BDB00DRAFT_774825 [Zychaea mexicana]KAI9484513.1 hypothetical protein BDB00DRAFT_774825 [Zychaea mexicana]
MLRQLTSFFFVLVITVGIPLTLYFTTRNHIEAIHSLLICAVLPLLYTIHVLIRHRRLDVFSFLLMLDYVIAGLVSLATGDATITTLRDSAATAVVSLVFYATMIPLRIRDTWFTNIRPLTFILSTEMLIDPHAKYRWINAKGMRQEMSVVDWIWSVRKVRIYHYWLTGGWATCLLVDYIIRVIMVLGTNVSVHMVYLSGSIIVMIELVIMTALGVIVAVLTRRVTRDWVRDNDYTEKYGWKVEQLRPSSEDSDSNGQEEEYDDPHHDV